MIDESLNQSILQELGRLETQGQSGVSNDALKDVDGGQHTREEILRHLLYLKEEGLIRGEVIVTGVQNIPQRMHTISLTSRGQKAINPLLNTHTG
jgi:hypothetical protein